MARIIAFFLSPKVLPLLLMGVRASTLAVKFLLTLFITRFMGLEEVGLYGLVAVAGIMAPSVVGCGFMAVTTRAAVTCPKEELVAEIRQYARFICMIYFAAFLCVTGYALWEGNIALALLIVAVVLLEHVNQDFFCLLLNLSRPLAANLLHFCRAALWALVFMGVAFVWPEYCSMEWLMGLWLGGNVVCLLGFVVITRHWPWRKEGKLPSLWQWMRVSFSHSRTLYGNSLVETAGSYLDRFVISLFLGLEMTGVYVLFLSISSALSNLVMTGVIQFARPRMVRSYKEKGAAYAAIYRTCLRDTFVVCGLLGSLAAGAMYVIIPYLNRPLVLEYFHILWLVLAGFICCGVMGVQNLVFYSQHKDGITLRFNAIFMMLMLSCNLLLIPVMGIEGAALTAIIAPLTVVALQYRRIRCSHLLNLS